MRNRATYDVAKLAERSMIPICRRIYLEFAIRGQTELHQVFRPLLRDLPGFRAIERPDQFAQPVEIGRVVLHFRHAPVPFDSRQMRSGYSFRDGDGADGAQIHGGE